MLIDLTEPLSPNIVMTNQFLSEKVQLLYAQLLARTVQFLSEKVQLLYAQL